MKAKFNEESQMYLVTDEGDHIGTVRAKDAKMLKWMEANGVWKDGDDVQVELKMPIVKTGTFMYYLEDPNKDPYRWKIWDDAERDASCYDFIDPKEAVYVFYIKEPWFWK